VLVMFEEIGGDPTQISFATKQIGSLCSHVSESHPPPVDRWDLYQIGNKLRPMLSLECPSPNQVITLIKFASFGTPQGFCGSYTHGSCRSSRALDIVQKVRNFFHTAFLRVGLLSFFFWVFCPRGFVSG